MQLVAYNVMTGCGIFECLRCQAMRVYRRRTVRRCLQCGHTDEMKQHIHYNWKRRCVGYSRLIPVEEWKNARKSIDRAIKDKGMRFKIVKTFAGFKVIVEIESVYKSDPRGFN